MTTGTKILLAVIGVFVGILVVYYGFFMSPEDGAPEVTDSMVETDLDDATDPISAALDDELVPVRSSRDAGLTMDSPTQPVLATEESTLDADVRPVLNQPNTGPLTIADRPAIGDTGPAVSTGGKDAPDPVARTPETATPGASTGTALKTNRPHEVAPETVRSERAAASSYTTYTVRKYDTLSSIAEDWFGSESKWNLIASANPSINPDRLRIGQQLRLPPKDATTVTRSRASSDERGRYVVRSGDTLTSIASARYGTSRGWRRIYDANRQAIGTDPNELRVGMVLVIPSASG